ncbi:MAG: 2-phosphosulfolactate phosphatase [Nocardioidaceae bacterium]|nr:2-phosphosulfolactate phosphatase [Nocardioidaceae bacterium]
MIEAHRQTSYGVRLEWGPTGAAAIADGADIAVVVDVLSFTTTVTVALEQGIAVKPALWDDGRAEVRRLDVPGLSPASMRRASGVDRLVLPSPNGSTICTLLADAGLTVVGASLRNATAVAAWLAPRIAGGAHVAVVAGGERWPDGSLRPAVEDLWGAGAVIARIESDLSPEARMARDAFAAADLPAALAACASGRELVDRGFAEDVEIAGELDRSSVVPVLDEERWFGTGG